MLKSTISLFDFGKIVVLSLRELGKMDCFIEDYSVRLVGGFDRTDLLLPSSSEAQSKLIEIANRNGLYVNK